MQTLHTLRLPAPPGAGPLAGLTASPIGRPIAALIDAWRRQRRHRATLRTLRALDDRTLRDLGFHRSEIGALAGEIGARAEITYVRAEAAHPLRA
jgi:uncharacterized protein YjiS (DUF1127 family)